MEWRMVSPMHDMLFMAENEGADWLRHAELVSATPDDQKTLTLSLNPSFSSDMTLDIYAYVFAGTHFASTQTPIKVKVLDLMHDRPFMDFPRVLFWGEGIDFTAHMAHQDPASTYVYSAKLERDGMAAQTVDMPEAKLQLSPL